MRGEAQKLRVEHQLVAAHAAVGQHDRTHLVELELVGDAAAPPVGPALMSLSPA